MNRTDNKSWAFPVLALGLGLAWALGLVPAPTAEAAALSRAAQLNIVEGTLAVVSQRCMNDLVCRSQQMESWKRTARALQGNCLSPTPQCAARGMRQIEAEREEAEIRRYLVTRAWHNYRKAERLKDCAQAYLEKRDEAEIDTGTWQRISAWEEKFYRSRDLYAGSQKLGRDQAYFDPLRKTETRLQQTCELMQQEFEAQDDAADWGVWQAYAKELLLPKPGQQKTNEEMALEAMTLGARDAALATYDGIKATPGAMWEWGQSAKALLWDKDPYAAEAYADVWDGRSRTLQAFWEDPAGQFSAVGGEILKLEPRQIGAITWGVIFGIVADRAGRSALSALGKIATQVKELPLVQGLLRAEKLAAENQALRRELRILQEINRDLQKVATTDPLTRLLNRQALAEVAAGAAEVGEGTGGAAAVAARAGKEAFGGWKQVGQEIALMLRQGRKVSLLYFDCDFFAAFNELIGHTQGDRMLQMIAEQVRGTLATLRHSDLVFRMGGEEFLVVLQDTDLEGAKAVAAKLQTAIHQAEERIAMVEELRRRASDASETVLEKAFRQGGKIPAHNNIGTISVGVREIGTTESLLEAINGAEAAQRLAKAAPQKAGLRWIPAANAVGAPETLPLAGGQ